MEVYVYKIKLKIKVLEKNTQYAAALNFTNCDGSYKHARLQFSESYGSYFIALETVFLNN